MYYKKIKKGNTFSIKIKVRFKNKRKKTCCRSRKKEDSRKKERKKRKGKRKKLGARSRPRYRPRKKSRFMIFPFIFNKFPHQKLIQINKYVYTYLIEMDNPNDNICEISNLYYW